MNIYIYCIYIYTLYSTCNQVQFQFTSWNLPFCLEFNHLNPFFHLGQSSPVAHGAGAGPGGGWQTLAQVLRQGEIYKSPSSMLKHII